MGNLIIGLGNTGTNIVKAAALSDKLKDVKMYVIDSVTTRINLDMINNVNVIPIISDEKDGSGRNRERGAAMYKYHESNGAMDELYAEAEAAKSPVLVITSAAGGTGSGSVVPLCEELLKKGVDVIPIIICPNLEDPIAFQLNTNDLFIELDNIGIKTYSIFRNKLNDADYTPINNDVVTLIEIIFGKRYNRTIRDEGIERDSIDDSDLDTILQTPGRFIAVSVSSNDIQKLDKLITNKIFSGFQPAWNDDDVKGIILMIAYSLKSMFAATDYGEVFKGVLSRIPTQFDHYREIDNDDNNGMADATMIIAGLPRPEMKNIDMEYTDVSSISVGMKKSRRPNFIGKKKANTTQETTYDGSSINKFQWK